MGTMNAQFSMGNVVRQVGASVYNAIAETFLYPVTDEDGCEQRRVTNCLTLPF